jgi:hypothetical protein
MPTPYATVTATEINDKPLTPPAVLHIATHFIVAVSGSLLVTQSGYTVRTEHTEAELLDMFFYTP